MTDKIILITGASRGIGAATARLAANRGYAVCINYRRNQAAADAVVADIHSQGGKAIAVKADVSQEADVLRLFDTVDAQLGRLTALVNNAAILEQQMRVEDVTADRLERIFQTNITGSFLCCREAIKRMSTQHGGHGGAIVNVSSVAARLGSANEYVDYAASKAAIDTLTRGLAKEVASEGVRVNAVRPGIIDTEIHASEGEPDRINRIAPSLPIRRAGQVDEIAHAILWLLSNEASYTTGALLDVTGGS